MIPEKNRKRTRIAEILSSAGFNSIKTMRFVGYPKIKRVTVTSNTEGTQDAKIFDEIKGDSVKVFNGKPATQLQNSEILPVSSTVIVNI